MKEDIIELLSFLIEVKSKEVIPEKYSRELDYYIDYLKTEISERKNPKPFNKGNLGKFISFIISIINSS